MESMRSVLCQKLQVLDTKCDRYLLHHPDDEYLDGFKARYNRVYYWSIDDSFSLMMQTFAQAVMDITYFEENQLVEKDFEIPNAHDKLNDILGNLNEIDTLCKEYTEDPPSLLGREISECLLWRKGAILYMYTATLEGKGVTSIEDKTNFLQYLHSGIIYLKQMLQVRKPLMVAKLPLELKQDTYFLLSEGIYSDRAILAFMYAGEMCYWFKKYSDEQCACSPEFNVVELGKKFLEKYIKTTDGPLKGRGWNASKARELLASFS